MSITSGINGYNATQPVQYVPPVPQKDADTQRFAAQTQARTDQPTVRVTLSPEAQKALAEQRTQTP